MPLGAPLIQPKKNPCAVRLGPPRYSPAPGIRSNYLPSVCNVVRAPLSTCMALVALVDVQKPCMARHTPLLQTFLLPTLKVGSNIQVFAEGKSVTVECGEPYTAFAHLSAFRCVGQNGRLIVGVGTYQSHPFNIFNQHYSQYNMGDV